MTWEYDQWWCECDGATTDAGDNALECLQCGKAWKWNETAEKWEEVV